jgi:hypothetical protein
LLPFDEQLGESEAERGNVHNDDHRGGFSRGARGFAGSSIGVEGPDW